MLAMFVWKDEMEQEKVMQNNAASGPQLAQEIKEEEKAAAQYEMK